MAGGGSGWGLLPLRNNTKFKGFWKKAVKFSGVIKSHSGTEF